MSLRKNISQDYTIKIISNNAKTTRKIQISSKFFRYIVISIVICALLFIGGISFAGYTFFANKVNQTTIAQLQKANSLQQEKITNMSKKTTKLEGYLNNLTSDAQKLKLLSNGSITEKSS